MLDSYFFIPGDKEKFINKIDTLNADYVIIDLEDAVSLQNKQDAFDLVMSIIPQKKQFVRIPFFDNCYSEEQLIRLINHFEGRIVIPKLKEAHELKEIKDLVPEIVVEIIVLVENPFCFINLPEILKIHSDQIKAIGFGSHDFCSSTGIKHTFENLSHYKRQLILFAKAYDVEFIDGVDLDLKDFSQFRAECIFAFEIGSSGKFLIHPRQLDELKSVKYMSDEELEQLLAVYNKVKNIPDDSLEVYTINGKVYEKPHILRLKYLMQKMNTN